MAQWLLMGGVTLYLEIVLGNCNGQYVIIKCCQNTVHQARDHTLFRAEPDDKKPIFISRPVVNCPAYHGILCAWCHIEHSKPSYTFPPPEDIMYTMS
ncbi:hypothetical protein B0O99DRAFT_260993 [Bisporella sp. PMI_857]|nr:hypothetical protein B0O99DRAFT_260993 [Bisporella sp. PMI_857]